MDVKDAVRERRSIREYVTKVPDDKVLKDLLQAGIWAPSGLNNQPWKFKIVKEKKIKDELSKFTKYAKIIKSAPVALCVFLDNGATYNREKDILAVGACIQNIVLQAHELGLGSCWLGEILNKREQVEQFLGVDSDYELMAVVTLGYSDEEVTEGSRNALNSFIIK